MTKQQEQLIILKMLIAELKLKSSDGCVHQLLELVRKEKNNTLYNGDELKQLEEFEKVLEQMQTTVYKPFLGSSATPMSPWIMS